MFNVETNPWRTNDKYEVCFSLYGVMSAVAISPILVKFWLRYAVGVYLAAELFLFLYLLR